MKCANLWLCSILLSGVARAEVLQPLSISIGDWPPYLSADLKHDGVVAHLISDIFADEGYRVSYKRLPWPRAYAEAASGRVAASAIWMHKTEREADFLFSAPVLEEQFVFFHLKSFPFDWQQLDDLKGMTLGGGLEYSYGPAFDAALAAGTFSMERVSSDQQNFEKLLKERVVLYPQEVNVGYYALMKHFPAQDLAKITHHPKPLLNNASYLMLPKRLPGSQALMQRFNQRLAQYRADGRYQRYFENFQNGSYFPDPAAAPLPSPLGE
ncbi:MAG: transporter substrate-binding domain-containing protein [Pseudomonas sp.]|uniref:substrate-binding periplasmic protein n=1 Tax=Pseudomonas sp. TaxID=306 RepID=UPI0033982839